MIEKDNAVLNDLLIFLTKSISSITAIVSAIVALIIMHGFFKEIIFLSYSEINNGTEFIFIEDIIIYFSVFVFFSISVVILYIISKRDKINNVFLVKSLAMFAAALAAVVTFFL